jgi:3-oxoacyl-[acyl-carrier protein] reductase
MDQGFRLDGLTALVTGASRGIGRAIALELARAGARVAVHYRSAHEAAESTLAEIRSAVPGVPLLAVSADLTDPESAERLAAACRTALGPVDILVNNAGIWNGMAIEDVREGRLEEMLNLNLKAVFRLSAAVVPGMKARGFGRLIGISSTAALLGEPDHSHYAASKGALEAMTRSLAVELGPVGITANTVAPGWTLTEMTQTELDTDRVRTIAATIPTRRLATPHDVAAAVRFLASREARHVNGICLPVEGGYRWRR